MKNFAFEKQEIKTVPVSIENHVYCVKASIRSVKAIEQYTKNMKPLIKSLTSESMSKKQEKELRQSVARITERCLDALVGKGTYYKIFADRAIDIAEHCNLMSFVFDQIKESASEYTA